MLEHTECPRCHAANLTTEVVCFACGKRLRPLPRRAWREATPEAPWLLWVGLLAALAVAGLAGWHAAGWIAGYRQRAAIPVWYLPALGILLALAGQMAFRQAGQRERRWWRLRRAPELKLSQARVGDAVWARGKVECDTPVIPPYVPQECAYYRYVLRERESGEAGWRVSERDVKAVDFRLVADGESVYVPSGAVLFDAPLYVDSYVDPGGSMQVRVWALPLGLPISLCGEIAGETSRPRADPLGEGLPVVATWRSPQDYVALVGRRARTARLWAWALTVLGLLSFIGGVARA
jgi:hypothetical protein